MAAIAAETPSRAEVNDAIERAGAGLAEVTDDDLDLEQAQEGLAKARDARDRGDLDGAFEPADKINLELDKVLDEQSGDN